MFFEEFISKLFSFDLFLTINLRDYIIVTNKVIDKNKKFFNAKTLLSSYLYRLKINDILSFRISRITLYSFIYNFLKIKS